MQPRGGRPGQLRARVKCFNSAPAPPGPAPPGGPPQRYSRAFVFTVGRLAFASPTLRFWSRASARVRRGNEKRRRGAFVLASLAARSRANVVLSSHVKRSHPVSRPTTFDWILFVDFRAAFRTLVAHGNDAKNKLEPFLALQKKKKHRRM